MHQGLASAACLSFESVAHPGTYLRHFAFRVRSEVPDGTAQFRADATFCPKPGKSGTGTSFASYNFPLKMLRHFENTLYVADASGRNAWDTAQLWTNDVSWMVTAPWAPQ